MLSLFLAFSIDYYISIPIQKLREGAESIGCQNFDVTVKVKSKDEFHLLAQTFNSMVVEIRHYAQSLEWLVKERMKDLMLNRIFSEFDRLADLYHLEEIKTIRDTYMAVAGIPQQHPHHAEVTTARVALDMIYVVNQLQSTLNEKCSDWYSFREESLRA